MPKLQQRRTRKATTGNAYQLVFLHILQQIPALVSLIVCLKTYVSAYSYAALALFTTSGRLKHPTQSITWPNFPFSLRSKIKIESGLAWLVQLVFKSICETAVIILHLLRCPTKLYNTALHQVAQHSLRQLFTSESFLLCCTGPGGASVHVPGNSDHYSLQRIATKIQKLIVSKIANARKACTNILVRVFVRHSNSIPSTGRCWFCCGS